jgi:heterogeneous nuclear ribonucleoprotein F/H
MSSLSFHFCQGLDPVDIVLYHRNSKFTGEAYVVLTHPAEMDLAMQKNKAYMGTRYVEVFEAQKKDYYRAIIDSVNNDNRSNVLRRGDRSSGRGGKRGDRSRSRSPLPRDGGSSLVGKTKVVKLRGLPFVAGDDDVVNWFNDGEEGEGNIEKVVIVRGSDGRATGMAFVEFKNPEAAEHALRKDRHEMGSRYIEVYLSSEAERTRCVLPSS